MPVVTVCSGQLCSLAQLTDWSKEHVIGQADPSVLVRPLLD